MDMSPEEKTRAIEALTELLKVLSGPDNVFNSKEATKLMDNAIGALNKLTEAITKLS